MDWILVLKQWSFFPWVLLKGKLLREKTSQSKNIKLVSVFKTKQNAPSDTIHMIKTFDSI